MAWPGLVLALAVKGTGGLTRKLKNSVCVCVHHSAFQIEENTKINIFNKLQTMFSGFPISSSHPSFGDHSLLLAAQQHEMAKKLIPEAKQRIPRPQLSFQSHEGTVCLTDKSPRQRTQANRNSPLAFTTIPRFIVHGLVCQLRDGGHCTHLRHKETEGPSILFKSFPVKDTRRPGSAAGSGKLTQFLGASKLSREINSQ